MKKQTKLEKIRENPYIISTIVLGILVLILMIGSFFPKEVKEKDLCSVISGTPAWIKNGKVMGYGVMNASIEKLIENNVEFYYGENCGYCKYQISIFDNWTKYEESGLTKKCF